MQPTLSLIALGACLLWLGACDKLPATPPAPTVVQPVPAPAVATAGSSVDPSVPSAESVFSASDAARADPAAGRSNSPMSAAQQSAAMPMAGQNNDHSAPLGPARRASSP